MTGFRAILRKEFAHIRRDPATIVFAIVVPALQLTIFGFAANVTIDNIPLAVLDLDSRQESRRLVEAIQNTQTFRVVQYVHSEEQFRRSITSGTAKAALLIPPDYSERLLRREQARVQVLVDGSDSQVAQTSVNTINLLATTLSIGQARIFAEANQLSPARDETGALAMPIEARTRLLFNPNLDDSYFFVPGLIAIILQVVLAFLTSFSVVKERELGTLEQLFVTPVSRSGLILGKLIPYVILALAEMLLILVLMVGLFGVPIRGNLLLLMSLSFLFILTTLGLGLLISTIAKTQLQAMQMSLLIMLPSVLLSGFVFPRSEMPFPLYVIGWALPVTYFLEILRGVVLRAADMADLFPYIAGLAVCCVVILGLSLMRFQKQLD